jgi:cell division protein ZapE
VWFDFNAICDGPRSSSDYVEIARDYHTVFVSGVPVLADGSNDPARRFIALVDEFYDRNVKLVLSAAAPPDALYRGERLAFEYQRTRSRLVEMQTHDYLARPHLG